MQHRERDGRELRAQHLDEPRGGAVPAPRHRRREQSQRADPRRSSHPELERHAPAHGVTYDEGRVERHGVEETSGPAREVRGTEPPEGLVRLAEPRQIGDEDVVVSREVPHHGQERRARGSEPVQEHHRRHAPLPGLEVEGLDVGGHDPVAARGAGIPLGGMQEVVELEGEGDVTPEQQSPVEEGLDSRGAPVEDLDQRGRVREHGRVRARTPAARQGDLSVAHVDRPRTCAACVEDEPHPALRRPVGRSGDAGAERALDGIDLGRWDGPGPCPA